MPDIILNCDDAKLILGTVEAERCECAAVLKRAMDLVTQAVLGVQTAQEELMNADLRVGRTRYLIRKNGFGDVLHVRSPPQMVTTQFQSSYSILMLFLPH